MSDSFTELLRKTPWLERVDIIAVGCISLFILPLKEVNPAAALHAIDLGCGRGEWLEILLAEGFCLVVLIRTKECFKAVSS